MTPDGPAGQPSGPSSGGSVPGPRSRELAERLARVESRNVTHLGEDVPIFWAKARGERVEDVDGHVYRDLTAGFGVASVGHRHPAVEAAVRRAASRLLHGLGDVHPSAEKVELLELLAAASPWEDARVILGVTGSDAVEAALKTALLATGKPGALVFTGAYHGLSYGTLALTDGARFRAPFEAQLGVPVVRAAYPHSLRPPSRLGLAVRPDPRELTTSALADVGRTLEGPEGARVGAVIVEPIQGRGGTVVPPPGFLAGLRALCDECGILLVADEIYTGLGRTGRLLALEREGVTPDLLCVGKGLAGGMPLSACLGPRSVMDAWPPSRGEAMHTSTFLGHPASCAAAVATLRTIRGEGLVARAAREGERWRAALGLALAGHPRVGEVRGRGLMLGVELVRDREGFEPDAGLARRIVLSALRRGWLLLADGPHGNVLSLTPPLTVERDTLDGAVELLAGLLREETGVPPGRGAAG